MLPLILGGLSLAGGIAGSKSSKKAQKEANAIARETLEFNKKRYNDYKSMYGGIEQQIVDDAKKGVIADLGGVTSRATADVATQFSNQEEAQRRQQQRLGINPNSGRADSMSRQMGLSKSLATAGNITTNRETERRDAEAKTWDRRAYVNNLGINQMNMAAQGIDNANNQLMNNYNNTAAQKAQQAGAFFGTAGNIAGQYLGGLSAASPITYPKATGLGQDGIPLKSAINPVAPIPTPKSNKLISGVQGGLNLVNMGGY